MVHSTKRKRSGFTLIELVIVVLVLGILAAVAAPRLFDVADQSRESATRQSLTVLRNQLELYRAQAGSYPSEASVAAELGPSLQGGTFPAPQIGDNAGDNTVRGFDGAFSASGTQGWAYDDATGDFRINDSTFGSW